MLYCRRALCDFEKGVIFLQEIYQLWSPTGQRVSKTTPLLGDIPRLMSGQADQKLAPFAAGVNPVRNSSPAIAGLETERGIKSR